MHILIDIRLLSRGGTTGIPGYTEHLVTALLEQSPEHTFTLFYNAFRKERALPPAWKKHPRVTIVERRIPNRLLSLFIRLTGMPSIEWLTGVPRPDLIWSPHLDLVTSARTPRVITVHDLSFIHFPLFFPKKYHLWSWLQAQERQAQTATHLIAVSHFTKNDLETTLSIPSSAVSVAYPGVDQSAFYPLEEKNLALVRYREEKKFSRPYLLFLGTRELRKNIEGVIRGFAELKKNPLFSSYALVVAGKPGFGSETTKKTIRSHHLEQDVVILDSVTDEERVYLYNGARVFIFPSFFEGFGFPPLEAQACGVPVVSTERGSLAEILADSATFCDPWRPTSIAEAITHIEQNPQYRDELIKKGRANAARFTWKSTALTTLAVFNNVYTHTQKGS